ncbi:glycosyltransferase [Albirhodobacter sp. R86504]|uniref:glycosyltransferase n=1 Tax=Albirhodobacter sp. R86504 TaxID=3093848 RepID=UPI00367231D1
MTNSIVPDINISYKNADTPAQEWDIVFTCFEPLYQVTGGIGTYHRLLIEALAKVGKRLLILTNSANAKWSPPEGATVFMVDDFKSPQPYNFVGLEHEKFSLYCHFALRHLFDNGHRFKFVEFSDYGADGFYPLRAHAAGVYDLGITAIRLHSPNVMLIEDNGKKHSQIDQYRRDIIDREMSAYDDCDVILFGGDAMRDRVLELALKFGLDLSAKMVKCPHPYPKSLFEVEVACETIGADRDIMIDAILRSNSLADRNALETAKFVGLFGRIEDRKGQYQFIWGLLSDPDFVTYLKNSDIHFVIAGHNVLDHIGNFKLSDLYELIFDANLSDRFHFTGRVSQDVLATFARAASGYIFASLFENYPNALLEVLPTTKPIAISARGCMPEITQGFRDVTVFDPLTVDTRVVRTFLETLGPNAAGANEVEAALRIDILESREKKMIAYYSSHHVAERLSPQHLEPVGFVVPIYQIWKYLGETLTSINGLMRPGDKVVVVDDASDPENYTEIEKICAAHGVDLLQQPKNSGPAAARLRGVEYLETNIIQFCDADDLLDKNGIFYARQAFANDPNLDMLTGIMTCFQEANHNWVPRNGYIWTAIEAHFAHSGSMFRRAAIVQALQVPHDRLPLNEDWLTSLLILAQGRKARMIPVVTYYYRRLDGTRSTQNVASTGLVHAQITSMAFENWSFSCPAQNSRLRELLVRRSFGSEESGQLMSESSFPLRYRILDAVFFRLVSFSPFEKMLLKLRAKLVRRF